MALNRRRLEKLEEMMDRVTDDGGLKGVFVLSRAEIDEIHKGDYSSLEERNAEGSFIILPELLGEYGPQQKYH